MPVTKDLSVEMCGVRFPNPICLSSSPVSNTGEMVGRAFDAGFGGVAFKTIGKGDIKIIHPAPRMAGYDYGKSNSSVCRTSSRSPTGPSTTIFGISSI